MRVSSVTSLAWILLLSGSLPTAAREQPVQKQPIKKVTMWTKSEPYSLDPFTYDYAGHHLAFTCVFSALVSEYQRGSVNGVLAQSWVSSDDFRTWEFILRDDMTFSNGDAITPDAVLKSLKRVALLQKKSDSKSGLFEHLVGLESFHAISDPLEGIQLEKRKLILRFHNPIPKLLGSISFSLYAIAHPDDYDHETGKWKEDRSAATSGPYSVREWASSELTLSLREDFPKTLRHPNAAQEVRISRDPLVKEHADIVPGDTYDKSTLGDAFTFYATSATTVSIAYVQCFTWNIKDSPCNDLGTRRLMRRKFYQSLEESGFAVRRSFFPKELTDFSGNRDEATSPAAKAPSGELRIVQPSRNYPPMSLATKALQDAAREANLTPTFVSTNGETVFKAISGRLSVFPFDICTLVTGILLEDSRDARFMIQSKEGIRLPDPDGRLHAEAAKPDLDYDKLEEILWDQAIIWPLAHFQDGLWVRKGAFDFSEMNLDLPATDFSWIGMK